MKANELATKGSDELRKELESLLKAQFSLRMQKATQQLSNTSQLRKVRRAHTDRQCAECSRAPGVKQNSGCCQGVAHCMARHAMAREVALHSQGARREHGMGGGCV